MVREQEVDCDISGKITSGDELTAVCQCTTKARETDCWRSTAENLHCVDDAWLMTLSFLLFLCLCLIKHRISYYGFELMATNHKFVNLHGTHEVWVKEHLPSPIRRQTIMTGSISSLKQNKIIMNLWHLGPEHLSIWCATAGLFF